ncbi:MAG TPA: mandelate racemase/muconate lactonizing enzyme family protein [Xanthobacteraceae bacterium]|nr:mandelate racemase/muconate lactonizing enzyme family protein [Xanthobacteraceae bacterium]
MKIVEIKDLHADGGWRTLSFLKLVTDEGIIGWSEFHEGFATPGLTGIIRKLAAGLIGADPRDVSVISSRLHAASRNATGGAMAQAIAALENACLDVKAKALGIPVYALFGGAFRSRLPMYWSQCGTLRTRYPALFGAAPLQSLDDIVLLGQEVKASGYRALKTNVLMFGNGAAVNYRPGFGAGAGYPELNVDAAILGAIGELLAAFRQGAGPGVDLMLDLNFNFRPEGVRRIAHEVERFNLLWLELDLYEPKALAALRQSTTVPIASLESLSGRRSMRSFLDEGAVDVAIIDPQWNGLAESMKIASLAESYEVNVAPHNFHGQLSTLIGAHLSAAIPNFRIMEFVVDEAPWTRDFLHQPLLIENGELVLPSAPGWGSEINEEAVRARPAKTS